VVLISAFVGVLIEFWKITRATNVRLDTSGAFPRLRFENKESYVTSKTKQYDDEASGSARWAFNALHRNEEGRCVSSRRFFLQWE
jgi:Cleft lip and palate transmembrane protein 1 (CLPTM1)